MGLTLEKIMELAHETYWCGLEKTCEELSSDRGSQIIAGDTLTYAITHDKVYKEEKTLRGVYEKNLNISLVCRAKNYKVVTGKKIVDGEEKETGYREKHHYVLEIYHCGNMLEQKAIVQKEANEIFKLANTQTPEQASHALETDQPYLPFGGWMK